MTESPQTPPVFKDQIPPAEAPAAQGAATTYQALNKLKAVEDKYKQREGLSQFVVTQPTPEEVKGRIEAANQAEEMAQTKLTEALRTDNVVGESGLNKLKIVRDLKGGRTEAERAEQVGEAEEKTKRAIEVRLSSEDDYTAASMFTKEYLQKESDPQRIAMLIDANSRRGPLRASHEMITALHRQDLIQQEIKYYQEKGIEVPADKMLPLEVFTSLRDRIGKEWKYTGENVDASIRMLTTFHESAIDYTDAHGLKVDQRALTEAVQQGMDITKLIGSGGPWDFAARRKGKSGAGNINFSDVGYYAIGSFQLEEFFSKHRIPDGEARVPYIMAYTGGVMENGAPAMVAHHMRDWLVDTLPSTQIRRVRKEGQWVDEQTEPSPRGFGSLITKNDSYYSFTVERTGTYDKGLVDVMQKAGEIVHSVDQKMKDRRVEWGQVRQFAVEEIRNPQLLQPEQ